jgi:hypothetical protein
MKRSSVVRSLVLLLALPLLAVFADHLVQNLKLAGTKRSQSIGPAEKRSEQGLHAQTASALIHQLTESGWVLGLGQSASERVSLGPQLPPGQPPLLEFRYLNEVSKYGLDRLRLVVDDAGH